jgi:hypothetical protein
MEELDSRWRKASYSDNGGNCVEVGQSADAVLVRDTKRRDGGELRFSPETWRAFASEVKQTRLTQAQASAPYGGGLV